jgi:hypothetical protein
MDVLETYRERGVRIGSIVLEVVALPLIEFNVENSKRGDVTGVVGEGLGICLSWGLVGERIGRLIFAGSLLKVHGGVGWKKLVSVADLAWWRVRVISDWFGGVGFVSNRH